jgi:hypothetical protein
MSGQEQVQQDAEGIDVRHRRHRLTTGLLRACVFRSHREPRHRAPLSGKAGVHELRNPEIEEFRNPLRGHEDVPGLDVAVNDQVPVGVLDRRAQLSEELQALRDRMALAIAVPIDGLPLDVLHDEVGTSVLSCATIEKAGDVRVIEAREDLSLPAKARNDLVPVHIRSDDLDRDALLVLLVCPCREVHAPHAPAPELLESLIGADPKLEPLRPGRGRGGGGLRFVIPRIHVQPYRLGTNPHSLSREQTIGGFMSDDGYGGAVTGRTEPSNTQP